MKRKNTNYSAKGYRRTPYLGCQLLISVSDGVNFWFSFEKVGKEGALSTENQGSILLSKKNKQNVDFLWIIRLFVILPIQLTNRRLPPIRRRKHSRLPWRLKKRPHWRFPPVSRPFLWGHGPKFPQALEGYFLFEPSFPWK